MPVKDGAQPAFIFTAVPQRGGTVGAGMGKGAAAAPGAGSFDILDLAFEGIAGLFPDDALYFGDKLPHIGSSGTAPVDDEACMLLADLGPADGKALKPALIY